MTLLLDMPPEKKKRSAKARAERQEAGVPEGGSPNYGTGVVKIDPELAFKLKLIADFRGKSIADLIGPHIRPIVESMYRAMLTDASRLNVQSQE